MRLGSITKALVAGAMVVLLSGAAYAMMAGNSVDGSNAGDGAGVVSGFHVSNIGYTLNSRGNINEVSFDLQATNQSHNSKPQAYVKDDSTGAAYSCVTTTQVSPNVWRAYCGIGGIGWDVNSLHNLEVIAVQS